MFNDIEIGDTLFPHKPIYKKTWKSPDGKTETRLITSPWTENGDAAYMMLG